MEFAFIVYLVGTVFPLIGKVSSLLVILGGLVLAGLLIFAPFLLDKDYDEVNKPIKQNVVRFFKWAIPIAFICGLAPSKEVSYTMIAAYTAQSIGENEKVQNIAGQSLEVVEAFLAKTKKEIEEQESKNSQK